uniref:Tyrosine specific protein phosphatases domain-containing protein n=1 Tax=Florenciella parvula TaxID=236787 RepID=A0A7S2BYD3_9STRA|mmetsp:Transcript_22183/g.46166  ORF Transcript_22183/g.46166 Transcript_22183/m.46166 type:complete len:335 (+) Transcript_22183:79-1083(+)
MNVPPRSFSAHQTAWWCQPYHLLLMLSFIYILAVPAMMFAAAGTFGGSLRGGGAAGSHLFTFTPAIKTKAPIRKIGVEAVTSELEPEATWSNYANWIIPGKLMVGRYPGVAPDQRNLTLAQERAHELVAHAKITAWVSLQEETPAQRLAIAPELKWHTTNGSNSYFSDERGGFDAYSPTMVRLNDMINGAKAAADLHATGTTGRTVTAGAVASALKAPPPTFLHFPITDLTAPSLSYMTSIVDAVQEQLDRGEVVYMHCWGGRGRSGTIGAGLMWPHFQRTDTPEQVLERLQRSFNTRGKPGASPETEEQREVILEYMAKHKAIPALGDEGREA